MDVQSTRNNDQSPREASIEITVQPAELFRFRYVTETPKCYGRIMGDQRSGFPTVQLKGCDNLPNAVIRCTLVSADEEIKCPHPHRLIRKIEKALTDDPIDVIVTKSNDYIARFSHMSIIQVCVKNIQSEILKKKRREIIERKRENGCTVLALTESEEAQIAAETRAARKRISLNKVALCFQGFYYRHDGMLCPLTEKVYSRPIKNSKNISTGRLKIHRILYPSGSCKGDDTICLLVDKVNKNDIQVRFCELDDTGEEIWNRRGKFTHTDVHKQCVIELRTPPYKNSNIAESKQVFVYLKRPSDGNVSVKKPFLYNPSNRLSNNRQPLLDPTSQSSSPSYDVSPEELRSDLSTRDASVSSSAYSSDSPFGSLPHASNSITPGSISGSPPMERDSSSLSSTSSHDSIDNSPRLSSPHQILNHNYYELSRVTDSGIPLATENAVAPNSTHFTCLSNSLDNSSQLNSATRNHSPFFHTSYQGSSPEGSFMAENALVPNSTFSFDNLVNSQSLSPQNQNPSLTHDGSSQGLDSVSLSLTQKSSVSSTVFLHASLNHFPQVNSPSQNSNTVYGGSLSVSKPDNLGSFSSPGLSFQNLHSSNGGPPQVLNSGILSETEHSSVLDSVFLFNNLENAWIEGFQEWLM